MTYLLLGTDNAVEPFHKAAPEGATAKQLGALINDAGHHWGLTEDGKPLPLPDVAVLQGMYESIDFTRPLPHSRVTFFGVEEDEDFGDLLARLKKVWTYHSSTPPTWVESDDDDLERLLAYQLKCQAGAPADVEVTHYTFSGPPGVGPGDEGASPAHALPRVSQEKVSG